MNQFRSPFLTLFAAALCCIISGEALANPPQTRVDRRYGHDVAYPRIGFHVKELPPHYARIPHHRVPYYYYGGVWYSGSDLDFEVVAPPIGVIAPVLPPAYTTIWYHGTPYYYGNNTYYVWKADRNGYMVVEPPADIKSEAKTTILASKLYAYPKHGQSDQQQSDDRFACHQWAVEETGYDPSQPPQVDRSELAQKRGNYQRAMKACLEAKGYSVR